VSEDAAFVVMVVKFSTDDLVQTMAPHVNFCRQQHAKNGRRQSHRQPYEQTPQHRVSDDLSDGRTRIFR
jgi:hypothetical protein